MAAWKTAIILLITMAITACSNRVYFGTSTRWALDASSTTIGLGYKAAQFAYIPPKKDGGEYSVLGKSDVDISVANIVVEEEFATGQAADCAAAAPQATMQLSVKKEKTDKGSLAFGSYFSMSFLDINFGSTNPFAGASIGYKRETATVIPITESYHLRSVYAKTFINTLDSSSAPESGTQTGGIRFIQVFATGKAAVYAARENVKSLTEDKKTEACTPQWITSN